MKKIRLSCLVLIIFVLMMTVTACGGKDVNPNNEKSNFVEKANDIGNVTLLVTRDFGNQIILNKDVEIKKDWNVIDLLEASTEITTKWDGNFVTGINGLKV
ncbi:hypothetical protein FQB35_02795 [Crassaminicella thermophila]|uniref:Uncharacterized protein n=1 Tax=Crassaminicella thermophila TaxID=2599308 RepID=A0A5C0S9P5_CRATE|nr:hypothetical protein [Crassaminicella thermophila]QEK11385.1 hypothetical protein FQB35_02795 [Crassaminicella thermophila]